MATNKPLNLPRGIRVYTDAARKKPHACQWMLEGKRRRKFFSTKEARDVYARTLSGNIKIGGEAALRFDSAEARDYFAFRAQLDADVKLSEVLRIWKIFGHSQPGATIEHVTADFLQAKKIEGVSPQSLSHFGNAFDRFMTAFAGRNVGAIQREEIEAWLGKLGQSPSSVQTHAKRIRSLFRWAKVTRLIAENPCEGLRPVRVPEADVETLAVAQGAALFAHASPARRETYGRLALEAFAGLRFSSAARIAGADINEAERGLTLPAEKIKTKRRQYIDGLPANLWAWLAWAKPAEWKLTERQYLEEKSDAFTRAEIPHPRNCLRHSFCSYHVSAHKDVSRTATILCHTSPKTLWRYYRGKATAADGAAWFAISPRRLPV